MFSVFLLVSCSIIADKPDAKKAALTAVQEYCEKNLVKEGVTFKIDKIESSVIQGNEALIKIGVKVITNGKEEKIFASVGCERDKENSWKATTISVQ